ncbi:hypothetical protein ACIRLA_36420 [Streptomyces sp. NPDC102364]|uniref:hypothetical protein n=1 Tax=Streptomyces sp. NPDC102364 TaxID=3366161 RepID=UPI00381B6A45
MTLIEDLLSRALLVRERTVPRDLVPTAIHDHPLTSSYGNEPESNEAAEDLRTLCETLVTHTPASAVADFVTEQVPDPRSALVLACVLQLTDTNDGARSWWQYAAGAGQPAAAYCLYLHHLALGEDETAQWWHHQTEDVQPPHASADEPGPPRPQPGPEWQPDSHTLADTTTILRMLRHLARSTTRSRTTAVTDLMSYVPTAVATGYLREPDMDLPMPGPGFASHVHTLLASTTTRRTNPANPLPARAEPSASVPRTRQEAHRSKSVDAAQSVQSQMGETAHR